MEMKRNDETTQSHGLVIGRRKLLQLSGASLAAMSLASMSPAQRQSSGPLQRREQFLHQRQGDHAKGHLQEPV